jgi:chromosomal replication initiation ATPase DnaA
LPTSYVIWPFASRIVAAPLLQQRLPDAAQLWLRDTELLALTDDRAVVGTPNCLVQDQVRATLLDEIHQALNQITAQQRRVQIEIGSTGGLVASAALAAAAPAPAPAAGVADAPALWQQALDELRRLVGEHALRTWFDATDLLHLDDDRAVIGTPNIFARDHVMTHYQAQIAQALSASCGRPVQVQIELGG